MSNLKNLSDDQLILATERLAADERRITAEVVRHFFEIDRRRLYAALKYPSMFEFAVKHLRYSGSCAQRRIDAARLLTDVPEVETAIREGTLSVAAAGQAQTFFRAEKKAQGKIYSADEKRQILHDLEGLSKRESERYFAILSPDSVQPDRVRAVDETRSEVRFTADETLMAKLERVREIWAHRFKTGDHNELLHLMADLVLEKSDPLKKAERAQARDLLKTAERAKTEDSLPPAQVSTRHSRYIVVAEQNFVQRRDQGACAFVSADGKRCGSRRGIQFDHYPIPFAMGGPSTRGNLRLVCRAHNALGAIQAFGARHMEQYLPGLT